MIKQPATNEITERIVGAAIDVHRALGPGLLESAYEACVCYELIRRGLRVERQKEVRPSSRLTWPRCCPVSGSRVAMSVS